MLARLDRVRKSYGKVEALAGVDLKVRSGQMLALLGPNGAGKSTAIGLLLGLDTADAGTVSAAGRAAARDAGAAPGRRDAAERRPSPTP